MADEITNSENEQVNTEPDTPIEEIKLPLQDDNEVESEAKESKTVQDQSRPKEEQTGQKENQSEPEHTEDKEKTSGHNINPEMLTVEGFMFLSVEDADKARLDAKKIKILGQKVKSTKVSDLQEVYEKAISNKIFSTPIGWTYLALLRDNLIEAGVPEDELTPIPVDYKITNVALSDEYHPKIRVEVPKKKKRNPKVTMILLGAMNVILVILVAAMFYVALNAETDNIINYKKNVTNRYAEWEQSLTEREKAVRQKEKELNIDDTTDYYQGE